VDKSHFFDYSDAKLGELELQKKEAM